MCRDGQRTVPETPFASAKGEIQKPISGFRVEARFHEQFPLYGIQNAPFLLCADDGFGGCGIGVPNFKDSV
jgi:hypothetical protein